MKISLKQRWQSESPDIFKKVTNVSLGIAGLSTTVLALSAVPAFVIAPIVFTISSKTLLVSTIVAGLSKLTIKPQENG